MSVKTVEAVVVESGQWLCEGARDRSPGDEEIAWPGKKLFFTP
jgi:hypothetical protein